MQVQLQDAFKAAADNAIEALKQELQKDGITPSGDITRNDPTTIEDADKIEIDVKGIPSDKSAHSAASSTISSPPGFPPRSTPPTISSP